MKKCLILLCIGLKAFAVDVNPTNNLVIAAGTVPAGTLVSETPIISTAVFFTISLTPIGVTIAATSSESELDPQALNDLTPSGAIATPTVNTTSQLIQDPTTATILVPNASVTKTYAQIAKDKKISLNFTIIADPDRTLSVGYAMVMQMLLQRLYLDLISPDFFDLQAFQLDGFGNGFIYHSINSGNTELDYWFLAPEGLVLSPTWETVQFLQVPDSSKVKLPSSTTFSFVITNEQVLEAVANLALGGLTSGTYWTSAMVVMQAYNSTLAVAQGLLDIQNQNTQIAFLASLEAEAVEILNPADNFYPLTAAQTAALIANQKQIAAELKAVQDAQPVK